MTVSKVQDSMGMATLNAIWNGMKFGLGSEVGKTAAVTVIPVVAPVIAKAGVATAFAYTDIAITGLTCVLGYSQLALCTTGAITLGFPAVLATTAIWYSFTHRIK